MEQNGSQENVILELEKTIRNVRESFNSVFQKKHFGVSYDQWLIIEQVMNKQGISQIEIANSTGKDRASISRIIKNLQQKGLLTKIHNEANKRANKVYLTPDGLELSDRIISVYKEVYQSQFLGIYEREMNFLKDILVRINQNKFVSAKTAAL